MKASIITPEQPKQFQPVHITFVFESQEELNAVGKLFNSGPVNSALRDLGAPTGVWSVFQSLGADILATELNKLLLKYLPKP